MGLCVQEAVTLGSTFEMCVVPLGISESGTITACTPASVGSDSSHCQYGWGVLALRLAKTLNDLRCFASDDFLSKLLEYAVNVFGLDTGQQPIDFGIHDSVHDGRDFVGRSSLCGRRRGEGLTTCVLELK